MENPETETRFSFEREPAAPWWLWLASMVVYLPVWSLLFLAVMGRSYQSWRSFDQVESSIRDETVVSFAMQDSSQPVAETAAASPRVEESGVARPRYGGLPEGDRATGGELVAVRPPVVADTGSVPAIPSIPPERERVPGSSRTDLAPSFGTGVLWGHLRPSGAEELAQQVLGMQQGSVLDSGTAVRLQRYIDSMAVEVRGNHPPSWVVSLGGRKLGVDQQWIHLGPIRIPTAVLALLPINIQSNPTEAEYGKRLNVMRNDLLQAAQRARNYAEFKDNVAQLRREKEAEREFRKNQRGNGRPLEQR